MDNFEVALIGVNIASKILQINKPEVRFVSNEDMIEQKISAIYLKDENIIAFEKLWVETANWLEVQATCFHEVRHAFQYNVIKGEYDGDEILDERTVRRWKDEFSQYHQCQGGLHGGDTYLFQDIEIDAIAFSHYQMNQHFKVKTFLPYQIKNLVLEKISKL